MELLNRYVSAVGKRLPRKNRADIEAEIRSTLQDMLEDRSRESGRPVDEDLVKEVLVEYGAPEKVAATYLPQRYLIGPRMYPVFWMIFRIVFIVVTALTFVGMGIRIGTGPGTLEAIARQVGESMLGYIQGMVAAFGNLVLVLAIIEYFLPAKAWEKEAKEATGEKAWDPASLMKEPEPDEVKLWDAVLPILFTALALVIFNFYPQVLRFTPSLNELGEGKVVFLPLLSETFFRWLPWINLLWGLQIALNLVLLRVGRWTIATRLLEIGLTVFGIILAVFILNGPSLVGLTAEILGQANMDATAAATLAMLIEQMVRVGLIVAIIAGAFDLIKSIYKLVMRSGKPQQVGV